MTHKLPNGLFIFRRDLRIMDNTSLNFLADVCARVYTIFIFTPEQVGSRNAYKSNNAVQFMIQSLKDLSTDIRRKGGHLYTFYGDNEAVLAQCIRAWDINMVAFNLDVSPYSRHRDAGIVALCQRANVFVTYEHDYYLRSPTEVLNGSGTPYVKFTPYYETARRMPIRRPSTTPIPFARSSARVSNQVSLDDATARFVGAENEDILVKGGRTEAIRVLRTAVKTQAQYARTHNALDKPTSHLSAYINFGNLSIREIYYAFRTNKDFVRQLYWGSFYASVLYTHPQIIRQSLQPKYDNLQWNSNEGWFRKWCRGETNFPIVDSCMKELNATGYLHGRGRLIVASFLVKTMMIDYKKGEKYFAQHLTDYNVANNLNNWMWITGNGASSQEYFKIFNVWTQGKEHDPDATYIKRWLPQLERVPAKSIHRWFDEWEHFADTGYGKPILDYEEMRQKALHMYAKALR